MNKEALKQIADLDEQIKKKGEEITILNEASEKLDIQRSGLLFKAIQEEGMLKDAVWELSIWKGREKIQYSLASNRDKNSRIATLLDVDYHSNYNLTDKVEIHFNDGDVDIMFSDYDSCIDFVTENGIKVDYSKLLEKINGMQKDLTDYLVIKNGVVENNKEVKMITRYISLSYRVLAVAKVNEEIGDWAAYIDAVEGNTHEEEWQEVLRTGEKLPKEVAEILFPEFKQYKWRN